MSGINGTSEAPLMYCSKGNVPVDSLIYSKEWEVNEDLIVFKEAWHDESGELVRNNVHMYAVKGLPPMGGQQSVLS